MSDTTSTIDLPDIDWSAVMSAGSSKTPLLGNVPSSEDANPDVKASGDGSLTGVFNSPQVSQAANDGVNTGFLGVFKDTYAKLGAASAGIQQAFEAGQQVSNQANADQLAAARAAIAASQAEGAVASNNELAKSKQDAYVANQNALMGATGPHEDDTNKNFDKNAEELKALLGQKKQLDSVSVWEHPIDYLYNNIIKIPILKNQIADTSEALKADLQIYTGQAAQMNASAQAAAALYSVHSAENAALISKEYLAKGIAATSEPLSKAAQLQLGAWNMRIDAGKALTSEADAQARIPLIQEQTEAYPEFKEAQTEQKKLIDQQLQETLNSAPLRKLQLELDIQKTREQINDMSTTPALRKLALEKLKTLLASSDEKTKMVNAGLAGLNLPSVKSYSELTPEKADILTRMGISLSSGGGYGGTSILNNVELLNKLGIPPSQLPGSYSQTINDIRSTELKLLAEAKRNTDEHPALNDKQAKQYAEDNIGEAYEKRYDLVHDDPKQQDALFSPGPLSSLIDDPDYKDNPVIKGMEKYVTDQAGRRIKDVPFMYKTAMETAVDLVHGGKITKDQALDAIQDIATKTLADKNEAHGFKAFQITADFSKQNIDVARPGSNPLHAHTVVDMKDRASIAQYLREAELTKYGGFLSNTGEVLKAAIDKSAGLFGVKSHLYNPGYKYDKDLSSEAFKPKAVQQQ